MRARVWSTVIGLVMLVLWQPFVLSFSAVQIHRAFEPGASPGQTGHWGMVVALLGIALCLLGLGLGIRDAVRRAKPMWLPAVGIGLCAISLLLWTILPVLNPSYMRAY